ncbi:hypothetical protein CI102_7281 [Trichoderma harzianum]|nr:hypothetical protein CI102_7281 [Trichoderma harzianum]
MLREKRVRGKRDSVRCGETMKNEERKKRASERIPDKREEEERKKERNKSPKESKKKMTKQSEPPVSIRVDQRSQAALELRAPAGGWNPPLPVAPITNILLHSGWETWGSNCWWPAGS